jgi:putative acyl-CoA dehydrogenase
MPGIHPGFFQDGPELRNSFEADDLLRYYLRWKLPAAVLSEIEPGLIKFGERCVTDILKMAEAAEAHPPKHVPYDPWGRRIDRIETSSAWGRLDRVAAEEGLVAIGYERAQGEYSRVHQFAKLYLFHPSSAFYSCPLAMTDGAARVLELFGTPELKTGAFASLTSRNPRRFWTSGQWMTERTGGSDVSRTSTIARGSKESGFQLYGDKWFTSATTSQMALGLAKVEGAQDAREGLSLFYIELRNRTGQLQNIQINRLKDKLGTKALPTAELRLEGVPALMVGEVGEGVKRISAVLNITRLYNSICSIGTIARCLHLARDYARRRQAFGKAIADQPLHLQTLADMQCEFEAVFHLVFSLLHMLGQDETGKASEETTAVLRLLTPVAKLWSAKQAISTASETIESFGGAGYIEDTGLPRLLRDSQVFAIWEGTTNVLSLDVLRAIAKDNALPAFFKNVESRLSAVKSKSLSTEVTAVRAALEKMKAQVKVLSKSEQSMQASARAFAFGLGRVFAASLMIEFAEACQDKKQRPWSDDIARRFCRSPLFVVPQEDDLDFELNRRIVYGS